MLDSSEVRESIRVSRSVQWPGPGVTRPGSDLNPLKPPALSTPSSGGDILQQFACLQTDERHKDNLHHVIMFQIHCTVESIAGTSSDAGESGPQAHNFMNHSL